MAKVKNNKQKLLLRENIRNVGRVGDIVEVSPGYARNYLIPQDLAVQPTPKNVERVEERKKEIERIEREERQQKEALVAQLESAEVTLERRANEQGHLFGSVTATDIAHELAQQGFNIEPTDVVLPERLDRIDKYEVKVQLAEDLSTQIKVWVSPDAESKDAIEEYNKRMEAEEAERAAEREAEEAEAEAAAASDEK